VAGVPGVTLSELLGGLENADAFHVKSKVREDDRLIVDDTVGCSKSTKWWRD
jgi:hypothetical protein